jgi:hypothetical protein
MKSEILSSKQAKDNGKKKAFYSVFMVRSMPSYLDEEYEGEVRTSKWLLAHGILDVYFRGDALTPQGAFALGKKIYNAPVHQDSDQEWPNIKFGWAVVKREGPMESGKPDPKIESIKIYIDKAHEQALLDQLKTNHLLVRSNGWWLEESFLKYNTAEGFELKVINI